MYRPGAFVVDDRATLHEMIRSRVFATLALVDGDRVRFAYAPVVIDADGGLGTIRFHLARANKVAVLADGAQLSVSFVGPDAYVSPDWYASEGQVPTWNYVAVEGSGIAERLDETELHALLADLSADEEAKLLPKKPWAMDKVPANALAAKLTAIQGFRLRFERLEGKLKLSQDKKFADFEGVLRGLDARGDAASRAVAAVMRAARKHEIS